MERLMISGNLGADCVVTPIPGKDFSAASIRVAVTTNKRSRRSGEGWGNITTWYECETVGRDAERWAKFRKGDSIELSGIPTVEVYTRRDGTLGHTIYLQECVDVRYTPKGSPDSNGASGGGGRYQSRTDTATRYNNVEDDNEPDF